MVQNSLGNGYLRLGEQQLDTALLKKAVAAYNLALEVRTHDLVH